MQDGEHREAKWNLFYQIFVFDFVGKLFRAPTHLLLFIPHDTQQRHTYTRKNLFFHFGVSKQISYIQEQK